METPVASEMNAPVARLARDRLGPVAIAFTVLAIAAPIATITGPAVLGIALGVGSGMPGAYLLGAIVLLIFGAGYVAMSRLVKQTGAFYIYITQGLGRPAGGAGAFAALLTYNAAFWAITGAFGYFASAIIADMTGTEIPWYVYSFVALAIIGILGRLQVDVSTKVLVGLMVIELLLFAGFDIAILAKNGFSAFTISSFSPAVVFGSGFGAAMTFAIFSYGGVEVAAIFAEESRNPEKTVGRATYGAIILIGVFYVVTTWCLIAAAGPAVQEMALADVGGFAFASVAETLGITVLRIFQIMVMVSFFASLIALHHSTARYLLALARDGLAPKVLARVHKRSRAPYIASGSQIVVSALIVLAFVLSKVDALLNMTTSLGGIATLGTMTLWALASIAIFVYFRKRGDRRWWSTAVAPALATIALGTLIVFTLGNYTLLTGVEITWINQLPWLLLGVIALGFVYVLLLRSWRPGVYRRVGQDIALEPAEERLGEPVTPLPTPQVDRGVS